MALVNNLKVALPRIVYWCVGGNRIWGVKSLRDSNLCQSPPALTNWGNQEGNRAERKFFGYFQRNVPRRIKLKGLFRMHLSIVLRGGISFIYLFDGVLFCLNCRFKKIRLLNAELEKFHFISFILLFKWPGHCPILHYIILGLILQNITWKSSLLTCRFICARFSVAERESRGDI